MTPYRIEVLLQPCIFKAVTFFLFFSAQVKIQDFTTDGMEQDGLIPQMITSDTQSSKIKGLLDIKFETNPIDKKCDQRIEVIAMPIKIIYDAQTINKIVNIFKIPSDTSLDQ